MRELPDIDADHVVGGYRLKKVAAAKGVVGQWFVEKLDETETP